MTNQKSNSAGFSLVELIIAMGVALVSIGIASTMLAEGLNIRTRENARADAVSDLRRALNIMSREIANAGANGMPNNGIVTDDSNATSIRILANINAFTIALGPDGLANTTDDIITIDSDAEDENEDVRFYLADTTDEFGNPIKTLVRHAVNGGSTSVLASDITGMDIFYSNQAGTPSISNTGACQVTSTATELPLNQVNQATYVVIGLCAELRQVGTPGSPGYQPEQPIRLLSTVALRNSNLATY
jgi:Tfp pilus assembly protein PilW